MSGPDQPTSLQPLPDPGEDALARAITEVLTVEASRIDPTDRLQQIRDQAGRPRRRWLPAAAAGAAAVLLVGGGAWAAFDHDDDHGAHRPATPVATSPAPGPAVTTPPTSNPTPTSTSSVPHTTAVTVPVYYLGSQVGGLFREFQRTTVPAGNVEQRVEQALRLATDPSAPQHPGDSSPWLPGTSAQLQVHIVDPQRQLSVFLPTQELQAHGRTAEQARLAAQQLAWTATAILQNTGIGVRILFGGQTGKLFGSLSTTSLFHRPPAFLAYQDLSAIWVLQPAQGSSVHSPVTVSGQACTFEANVAWQLLSGSAGGPVVRSGRTLATGGCPIRGTWQVVLKALPPGSYTFRAYEPSPKGDGSFEGLDTTSFVVH